MMDTVLCQLCLTPALFWTNMDHTEICTITLSADPTIKIYQNVYTSFDEVMFSQTIKSTSEVFILHTSCKEHRETEQDTTSASFQISSHSLFSNQSTIHYYTACTTDNILR
jgi:hypothetical protein